MLSLQRNASLCPRNVQQNAIHLRVGQQGSVNFGRLRGKIGVDTAKQHSAVIRRGFVQRLEVPSIQRQKNAPA